MPRQTLGRRAIVIMDKLPAHQVADAVDAIEPAGASVLYLPSYSAHPNPIELFQQTQSTAAKSG
jgi:transposase